MYYSVLFLFIFIINLYGKDNGTKISLPNCGIRPFCELL